MYGKPQRLIVLMEITKTSNKALANYLHVDPSMISQVRTGRRKVPEKSNYKYNTARYFSTQFKNVGLKSLSVYIIKHKM